ncbi:MAG: VWA domain-containing protein [Pseudomonadota bacterium]
MLVPFFSLLRDAGLKTSITELLTLLDALSHGLAETSAEQFYYLARTTLIKDESQFDRFDQVYTAYFNGLESLFPPDPNGVPDEWLEQLRALELSDEEKAQIAEFGSFDELMEALRERLEEQRERHEGGNKWIGTGGTSPFGHGGYNPAGVRIGGRGGGRRAVKVWEKRQFRNLDDSVQLGTRNIKLALRKLRKFARDGAVDQLDLPGTIAGTARNGGLLDIRMQAERRNTVKVLLCLDIGGSMDDHVRVCEELFSAARSEFKNLEYFYFHNFLYESLWKDNRRRHSERIPTDEIIRTYGQDYKLVLVGDATMSPYEIVYAGGSVEHWNEEPGSVWLSRLLRHFDKSVWINPEPQARWEYTPSVKLIHELMSERMFPLTLSGLDDAIRALR